MEFVRQYAAAGATVHALCRNPAQATELQAVADDSAAGLIRVHEYDQTNEASVRALQLRFAGVPVDILINNAGISRDVTFRKMTDKDWDMLYKAQLCPV